MPVFVTLVSFAPREVPTTLPRDAVRVLDGRALARTAKLRAP